MVFNILSANQPTDKENAFKMEDRHGGSKTTQEQIWRDLGRHLALFMDRSCQYGYGVHTLDKIGEIFKDCLCSGTRLPTVGEEK